MRTVSTSAAIALLAACGPSLPHGQYGTYQRSTMSLTLPSAEVLPVYRVKYWRFADGSPPALQLEYEPPFAVADTIAVHRKARELWPAFAAYVEATGVTAAIVTATNLEWKGLWPVIWTTRMKHFGIILEKDSTGAWVARGDTIPFPAGESPAIPRITDANGKTFPIGLWQSH